MKYLTNMQGVKKMVVAPLVGVWIEISLFSQSFLYIIVAPLVGVWIEIVSWRKKVLQAIVAPLVGVWIEMVIMWH